MQQNFRNITIFISLLLIFSLIACDSGMANPPPNFSSVPAPAQTTPDASIESAPLPSETPPSSMAIPDYSLTSYTASVRNSDGYVIEATLEIGSWIKASDTEALTNAWISVGGEGDAPTAEVFEYKGDFRSDRSVIVFGTMSFKNLTTGFDITSAAPLSTKATVDFPEFLRVAADSRNLAIWRLLMAYSSGIELSEWQITKEKSVSAKMTSNLWGPTPIAISISNVFNPNFPDGNPNLLDLEMSFGDQVFQIGRQWDTAR